MDEILSKWINNQLRLLELELSFEQKRGDAHVSSSTCSQKPVIKILDVESITPSKGHYLVDCEIAVSSKENFQYFSTGDIVGFVEGPGSVVLTGILADFTAPHISVSVTCDPSNILLQEEKKFSIIKLTSDVTFKRMKNALLYLKSPSGFPGDVLIPLLFGKAQPVEIPLPPAILKNSEINFINGNLHPSQKDAVSFSLKQKNIAIIQGPPGTGKTTTLVEIILQLVKTQQKVLVTAPSNIAVDNVLERLVQAKCCVVRLGHPARMSETFQEYSLDSAVATSDNAQILSEIRSEIREASRKLRRISDETRSSIMRHVKELRNEIKMREMKSQRDVMFKADVVLCTLTTASLDGPLKLLPPDHFDVVVIDECSQGMEAACWIALPKASKVIMAGDHMQLPPTVLNPDSTSALSVSLMERAVETWPYHMLTHQFRMNESIMKWVSQKIYSDKLTADASVAKHLLKDLPGVTDTDETGIPLLFIDTAGMDYEETVDVEGSYSNDEEANVVVALVNRLLEANVPKESIAVISPYSNQVQLIRSLLPENNHVEVKTVDGFQGREKEAVILSLVRTNHEGNLGFLTDKRRLNVAVSRARRFLGVVGDSVTVSHDETIKSLTQYIEEHGTVLTPDFYTGNASNQASVTRSHKNIKEIPVKEKVKNKKKKPSLPTGTEKSPHKNSSQPKKSVVNKSESVPSSENATENANINETIEASKVIDNSVSDIAKWKAELEMLFVRRNDVVEQHFKNLTSYDRRLIHEAASQLNLEHESFGEGKNRYIVVRHVGNVETNNSVECEIQERAKNEKENLSKVKLNKKSGSNDVNSTKVVCNILGTVSSKSKGEKSNGKKKNQHELENVNQEDIDGMLDYFRKIDLKCHYDRCKKSTELISSTCIHCKGRFCFTHALPEVHGCGEAARKHAQHVFRHPPPVKSDEQKRNQALKKLHNKLKEKNDERKAKQKK